MSIRESDVVDAFEALRADLRAWAEGPPGSSFTVRRTPLSGIETTDAAGAATITIGRPPEGSYWLVDRGAFVVDGAAGATIAWSVFTGAVQDDLLEDFGEQTLGAAGTDRRILEASPPIWVPSRSPLIVTVTGASAGVQARARTVQRVLANTTPAEGGSR